MFVLSLKKSSKLIFDQCLTLWLPLTVNFIF